jgi:hypothetical protein
MRLELNDIQTEALIRELSQIIDGDRYPLSPRIVALKEILGLMRPDPARPAPLPPRRHFEPPSKGRYSRAGGARMHPQSEGHCTGFLCSLGFRGF